MQTVNDANIITHTKGCSGGGGGSGGPLLTFSIKSEGAQPPPQLFVLGYNQKSYNAKKAVKK